MKSFFELAACALLLLFTPFVQARAESERPNVVIILADDLGFSDLGCYGGEVRTPVLDRLASHGLRMTQFYNTGRCWPTRASIMTGYYPHQARYAMPLGPKAPPAYSGIIPERIGMMPALLKAAGYRSYHSGKWHLNIGQDTPNHTFPRGRGFDRSYFVASQQNFFSPKLIWDDDKRITRPGGDYYATDAITEATIRHLKDHQTRHADRPFLVYLAYTAPHFPLHARAEDIALYRGQYRMGWDELRRRRHQRLRNLGIVDCELSPRDPDARAWDDLSESEKDEWDGRMATHAAMVHRIDIGVGRVVEQLRAMGELDNTLILFLSDNGASAEYIVRGDGHDPAAPIGSGATYRCIEVGWSNAANTPFRMHKIWTHEGGIATPLIAHWPKGIKARGELLDEPGHVIDLLPTVLDLAGMDYPERWAGHATEPPPGRSLAPLFSGRALQPRDFIFWEHFGNKALRVGDWKLVAEYQGPWELYNLADDRSELNNLASNQPDRVASMVGMWESYASRTGVVDWSTFDHSRFIPWPDYRMK